MKTLRLGCDFNYRASNSRTKYGGPSVKRIILFAVISMFCLVPPSLAQNDLLGKWRALDETNIIYGFPYFPEIKFSEDGTLHAGLRYGYKILDDSKFLWQMGYGVERVYKYEITGDLLVIHSEQARDVRARFQRVR